MSNFWKELIDSPFIRTASSEGTRGSLDFFLSEGESLEGKQSSSMRKLTDQYKNTNCLQLPVDSGKRVSFIGNLGSVLSYKNPPAPNSLGTVVTVRTAYGDSTTHEGMVFVKWDTGEFGSYLPSHLFPSNTKQAQSTKYRCSNFSDLSALFASSNKEGELIHKATQDLWSFKQTDDGFLIERLFDDTGSPLKV